MKNKRKNYKFTLKSYKQSSIMSAVTGVISLATILTVIALAFLQKGEVTASQTLASIFVTVTALAGLCVAIWSLADKEQYHLFAKIGFVLNGLCVGIMVCILYLGVM